MQRTLLLRLPEGAFISILLLAASVGSLLDPRGRPGPGFWPPGFDLGAVISALYFLRGEGEFQYVFNLLVTLLEIELELALPDLGPDVVVLAPAKYVLPRDGLIGTVVFVGHHQVTDVLKSWNMLQVNR